MDENTDLAKYLSKPSLELQNRIVIDNTGLVHSVIERKFSSSLYKEDLRQEGLIALSNCIPKYEETKGAFSTFATRCITNRLINFVTRDLPKGAVSIITNESTSADLSSEIWEHVLQNLTPLEKEELSVYLKSGSKRGRYPRIVQKVKQIIKSIE